MTDAQKGLACQRLASLARGELRRLEVALERGVDVSQDLIDGLDALAGEMEARGQKRPEAEPEVAAERQERKTRVKEEVCAGPRIMPPWTGPSLWRG